MLTHAQFVAHPTVTTAVQSDPKTWNPAALTQLLKDFGDNAPSVVAAIQSLVTSGVTLAAIVNLVVTNGPFLGKLVGDIQALLASSGKMTTAINWQTIFAAVVQFLMTLLSTGA